MLGGERWDALLKRLKKGSRNMPYRWSETERNGASGRGRTPCVGGLSAMALDPAYGASLLANTTSGKLSWDNGDGWSKSKAGDKLELSPLTAIFEATGLGRRKEALPVRGAGGGRFGHTMMSSAASEPSVALGSTPRE